ncbi:UNVERIFIED_CONTAM: hypothetical protein H355_014136 [Colinus virginianus]|nr:hypothetical protein H355_014136 [Colinus virginianus]
MGTEGAKAFSAMLLENTTVVTLQLSGNEFDDHAAKYLADAITANSKVEVLDLSYNKFGDKAGELLGVAIAENIGLKELKIAWNHFHSEGAVALAKGVGMIRNPMQNKGCCGILKALQANSGSGMEILDLPVNLHALGKLTGQIHVKQLWCKSHW